jgi:hypothetical protein
MEDEEEPRPSTLLAKTAELWNSNYRITGIKMPKPGTSAARFGAELQDLVQSF